MSMFRSMRADDEARWADARQTIENLSALTEADVEELRGYGFNVEQAILKAHHELLIETVLR